MGDIVDGAGDGERCCELLRDLGVATVRGNHDRWLLEGQMRGMEDCATLDSLKPENVAWLRALPRTLRFETTRGPLLLCHGVGENDMNKLAPDDYGYALECNDELQALIRTEEYRFVVGGHTHQRMVKRFGPLIFINPGALPTWSGPCFAVADFGRGEVNFCEFEDDSRVVTSESASIN